MMRSGVSLVAGVWLVMASREKRQLIGLKWLGWRVDRRRAGIGRRRGERHGRRRVAEASRLQERGWDQGGVGEAGGLDRRRPQGGRRVVHGEDPGSRGTGCGGEGGGGPVRPADRGSRHEPAHRMPPKRHHEGGIEHPVSYTHLTLPTIYSV